MKKIFLFLCFIAVTTTTTYAQLGKMQYEDAEEQYALGKYEDALVLLDKSEASLGKTNPMIEHLRIVTMTEIAKQKRVSEQKDYLTTAQRKAAEFLKAHNGNASLEDKYRDVYKASKTIKELILAYNGGSIIYTIGLEDLDFEYLNKNYKFGMTDEELRAVFPGHVQTKPNSDGDLIYACFNGGPLWFYINPKTGKSYGYWTTMLQTGDKDVSCSAARKYFETQAAAIGKTFGQPTTKSGKPGRWTQYIWQLGTKKITLNWDCYNPGKGENIKGGVEMYFHDDALKN